MPRGAEVLQDGLAAPLGTTPLVLTRARAASTEVFRVRLAGYPDVSRSVSLEADAQVAVAFGPVGAPARPEPPRARPPRKRAATVIDRRGIIDDPYQ
jgi:hypothetical protein